MGVQYHLYAPVRRNITITQHNTTQHMEQGASEGRCQAAGRTKKREKYDLSMPRQKKASLVIVD